MVSIDHWEYDQHQYHLVCMETNIVIVLYNELFFDSYVNGRKVLVKPSL